MVGFEGPVLADDAVAEVADLLQHGVHEGGAKLGCVVLLPLSALRDHVLGGTNVVVEGWAVVQEGTSTLHVPEVGGP